MKQLLQIGAEARIYRDGNALIKERIKKGYRHDTIDQMIRKRTTRFEGRLLKKAAMIIPVPKLMTVDEKNMVLVMEYLNGKKLRDCFNKINKQELCTVMGKQVAALHDHHIIHGDLTTSNMILHKGKLFFIDFGLGFVSARVEDKAVDLHLLKRALDSKHYQDAEQCFRYVLKGYSSSKNYAAVIERFNKVEKRGRYKRKGKKV